MDGGFMLGGFMLGGFINGGPTCAADGPVPAPAPAAIGPRVALKARTTPDQLAAAYRDMNVRDDS